MAQSKAAMEGRLKALQSQAKRLQEVKKDLDRDLTENARDQKILSDALKALEPKKPQEPETPAKVN